MLRAQACNQHSGGWGRIIRSSRLAWANEGNPVINETKETKRLTMTAIGEEGSGAWAAPTPLCRGSTSGLVTYRNASNHDADVRIFIAVLGQGRQQLPPSRREERKCTEERDVTKREDSLRSGFGGIYRISYGYRDVRDDLSLPAMPPLLLPGGRQGF